MATVHIADDMMYHVLLGPKLPGLCLICRKKATAVLSIEVPRSRYRRIRSRGCIEDRVHPSLQLIRGLGSVLRSPSRPKIVLMHFELKKHVRYVAGHTISRSISLNRTA